jgi:CDP-diacylglycerol--glycerol-3-phosphate 3-phosphatidyltransferase
MNLPNALTLLRIFIVPLLVVVLLTNFSESWIGVPQHILGSVSSRRRFNRLPDGYLARRRGEVSRLGTSSIRLPTNCSSRLR